MKQFLLRFFQHCAWALSIFCVLAFMMEWLMPGSVTPYVHLIPFAIVAVLMLGFDAFLFHDQKSVLERMIVIAGIVLLSGIVFLSFRGSGITNLFVIGILIVMMVGTGLFLFLREE